MTKVKIDIVTCPQWGASQPRQGIKTVGKSQRVIIHHTAGHHAEIENPKNESLKEAIRYARDIQNFHMNGNGWIDSGHNFLVCRNGVILQGRWLTVSAIESGHMVESAHCPGQNDQIGIEHEHDGVEPMTVNQLESSSRLIAWITDQYGLSTVPSLHPHRQYYSTACPANLASDIPHLYKRANEILRGL